ncbi:exodeoxyribonuclease III [Deinococcus arenicola]|uniref:Exodeoxyribonuclease III n=1 Tax=Deinococcus arenicola TaxID=2994950 RepID=A0ABU4DL35_9DEIO|nr:exodeoxyribonuclease III [Deinococcus sp. ZS9-10]MDV6373135.1 exodeoxyribonuclease III [Deinococcus sp. ZS9-10]
MSAAPDSPTLKVTTLNANGIRSALRKGLADWVEREAPDVLLLQEVRAGPMPEALAHLGYQSAWFPAQKAGYSGVAILARGPLEDVRVGMGHDEMDAEGRVLSARIGGVRYVSVYLPSGSRGARQDFKDRVLGDFQDFAAALMAEGEPVVIGGDYNVAHREIDLKNWRSNRTNSGFLPHEREWMTAHLASGLTDTHRATLGDQAEYTWWSNRSGAYDNNVGWRIDYLLSAGVHLGGVGVDRGAKLSDHAPLSGWIAAVKS